MAQLYFAYGSNMNRQQMAIRCPGALVLGPAALLDYALAERMHADVEPCLGDQVDGVLWKISAEHERWLDAYEGYHAGYYQKHYLFIIWNDRKVRALVYVMSPQAAKGAEGEPFTWQYREGCRIGAEQNGVPVHPLYQPRTGTWERMGLCLLTGKDGLERSPGMRHSKLTDGQKAVRDADNWLISRELEWAWYEDHGQEWFTTRSRHRASRPHCTSHGERQDDRPNPAYHQAVKGRAL